ncbi:hypothetical protein BVD23_10345 [Salmonella enterica]|nr:hypothetical protein [Salmonella enterica]ECJ5918856.1 SEL1-like repeat protein [Salmonella enterica subsp. salamae]HCM1831725.1 SEL1-like repeat protein [Salmonella enterica subsp. salamae serovar 48:z81:z39]HCM1882413.1 SEL1-like repeat protein [Salmonella enterica subsp. salamae serovar 60:z10:z39]EAN4946137.1 hypothetical protein [Salmonella enterica]
MDYVIAAAMLPQDKLWTVEYSWKMAEAITPEIPQIEDEAELIELIRHAWMWDKNAMIQYARIQKEVGDDDVLDNFIRSNAQRLVSYDGLSLRRPDVFNMNYSEFITRLADLQYPLASRLAANGLLWSAGETGSTFNPLAQEARKRLICYTRYAIKGGYHIHSYLADYILFSSGFAYKDSNNKQLNSLENRMDNLTREELEESFAAYKVSGIHGSQYAQIRLSEFYFYGVGVERDITMAYAWSMIANDSFIYFNKEGYKSHASEKYKENILNEYNHVNLMNLIPLQMTKIEIERSVALASKIKETLVEDDYYSWEVQMDAVPPAP